MRDTVAGEDEMSDERGRRRPANMAWLSITIEPVGVVWRPLTGVTFVLTNTPDRGKKHAIVIAISGQRRVGLRLRQKRRHSLDDLFPRSKAESTDWLSDRRH
jgi:hypothetical protein